MRRLLPLICLLLLLAATGGKGLCPTTYSPVVDPSTGIPFYNDCLARHQLARVRAGRRDNAAPRLVAMEDLAGLEAERPVRQALSAESSAWPARGGVRSPSAADFARLLPPPSSAALAVEETAAGHISSNTMDRFADEGFFYVGRPGFLKGLPRPESDFAAMPGPMGEDPPTAVEGSRVSLRIVYPEGDLYMKVWSGGELEAAAAAAARAEHARGSLSRASAPADGSLLPRGSGVGPTEAAALDSRERGAEAAGERGKQRGGRRRRRLATLSRKLLQFAATIGSDSRKSGKVEGGPDGRREPASNITLLEALDHPPGYPYTAVSYIRLSRGGSDSAWCSGAMVGPTGRLVLTAARCLYDYDPVAQAGRGCYAALYVTPGYVRQSGSAVLAARYGRVPAGQAEVLATWSSTKGSFDFGVGVLRLNYHYTDGGTLGLSPGCPQPSPLALASAGYPADQGLSGPMWRQHFSTAAADLCATSTATAVATATASSSPPGPSSLGFSYTAGQNGSALWTDDNNIRLVMDTTAGTAVPITQATVNWLLDYTSRAVINTPHVHLAGGGSSGGTNFIKCSAASRTCVGTNVRAESTAFHAHPIGSSKRFAFRVLGQALCLAVTGAPAANSVNLSPCNQDNRFIFAPSALWTLDIHRAAGYNSAARSEMTSGPTSGPLLKFNGPGRGLTAVGEAECAAAPSPSVCAWSVQPL